MDRCTLSAVGNTLVVTCSPLIEAKLSSAILSILQYDKDPVGDARACQLPDNDCLVALCLEYQILASVGLAVDVAALVQQVEVSEDRWLPWELRHAGLVIRFCKALLNQRGGADSLRYILVDCVNALELEPHDVFTARLAMITAFLSGEYELLSQAMWAALRHDIFKNAFQEGHDGVVIPHLDTTALTSAPNVCAPYLMTFLAFGLEEIGFAATVTKNEPQRAKELIDVARQINDAAIRLVESWNSEHSVEGENRLTHVFAVHVACHLYEAVMDSVEGIRAIEKIDKRLWVNTAHLVVHCWWHVALFHLDSGDVTGAVEVFQKNVLPHVNKHDPFSLSDATAFLVRLTLLPDGDRHDEKEVNRLIQEVDEGWDWWRTDVDRKEFVLQLPFFNLHNQLHAALVGNAQGTVIIPPAQLLRALRDAETQPDDLRPLLHSTWIFGGGRDSWWKPTGGSGAQRELLFRLGAHTAAAIKVSPTTSDEQLNQIRNDIEQRAVRNHLWFYLKLNAKF